MPTDPTQVVDQNLPNVDKINAVSDASLQAAQNLNLMGDQALFSQKALGELNSVSNAASSILNGLEVSMNRVGISLNQTGAFTEDQTTQFALLSNAVLGAKASYTGFANVDTGGLNTFSSQISYITENLGNTESGIGALVKIAKDGFGAVVPDAIKASFSATQQFVLNLATSADNALKLQNGLVQLAGKTGNLGNIFKLAGNDLGNINVLLEMQARMMTDSSAATGIGADVVEKYYSQLGSVPQALEAMVTSTGNAGEKTSMLTAAMQVATGTGRSFEDVVSDVKVAFQNYGIVGEPALKFSAEISDVTQKLGVELDVVKGALRSGSDAFKMYVGAGDGASRMASGLAEIMSRYGTSLQSTGLSGTQAVSVIQNMTSHLSDLTIAQKSFLSSQTGGAGGLMGAFQIDKMMREGNIQGVMDKVRKQMSQQFGRIVTLDEASQSQAGAAQMTRQMMLLRSGPLGSFVKDDASAQRLLEGFKAEDEGKGGAEIVSTVLKDAMDKGSNIQEKSYTVLSEMRSHLEALRRSADIGTLGVFQKSGITAGSGVQSLESAGRMEQNDAADRMRAGLKSHKGAATSMDAFDQRDSYGQAIKDQKLGVDTSGRAAVSAINDMKSTFGLLPDLIKGPMELLKKAVGAGDTQAMQSQISLVEEDIKRRKQEVNKLSIDKRSKMMSEIAQEEGALSKIKTLVPSENKSESLGQLALSQATKSTGTYSSSVGVGRAAGMVSNTPVTSNIESKKSTVESTTNRENASSVKNDITVHVTGFCLKCKQEIDNQAQSNSVSVGSKVN